MNVAVAKLRNKNIETVLFGLCFFFKLDHPLTFSIKKSNSFKIDEYITGLSISFSFALIDFLSC